MEQFKKDFFYKEYGKQLEYQTISGTELSSVNAFVESELGSKFDSNSFFTLLTGHLKNVKTFESLESKDDIKQVLYELQVLNQESVLVIWNYPNKIDNFNLTYLIQHWENIWFGVSDDVIGLFFPKLAKMVLITHWNAVHY